MGVSFLRPLEPSVAEVTQRGRRRCRAVLCDRLCAEWGLGPECCRYVDRNRVFRVSPTVACSRRGVAWRGVDGAREDVGGGCAPEAAASKPFPGWLPLRCAREKAAVGAGSGVGLCRGTASRPGCCVFLCQPPLPRRCRCVASPPPPPQPACEAALPSGPSTSYPKGSVASF